MLVLAEQLPTESAFSSRVQGGREHRGWDGATYLLANLVDAVQINTAVTARAAGAKKFPVPDPVWRPGRRAARTTGRPLMAMSPLHQRPRR